MRLTNLFLDSFAIGVVVATLVLQAIILLDPNHYGAFFTDMPAWLLTLLWLQLSVLVAPFATLMLLGQDAED